MGLGYLRENLEEFLSDLPAREPARDDRRGSKALVAPRSPLSIWVSIPHTFNIIGIIGPYAFNDINDLGVWVC